MKKCVIVLLMICGLLAFGSSAWSYTVNSGLTDVGMLDTFIAATYQQGNPTNELSWVQSVLDPSISFLIKDSNMSGWKVTDTAGIYAFNLTDSPDYFLLKTGNVMPGPNGPLNLDILYANNNNMDWAVFSLNLPSNDFSITAIKNVGKISHVDEYNGTQVPEPSMMMLFGSGLLGLGFFGRKKFKK